MSFSKANDSTSLTFAPDASDLIKITVTGTVTDIDRRETEAKEVFHVSRALLCARSDHFCTAMKPRWAEGQKELTIPETRPAVFRCFVRWLENRNLSVKRDEIDGAGSSLEVACFKEDDQVTWPWEHVLQLYVFGDRYDTRHFRNDVYEAMQALAEWRFPRKEALELLCDSLPDNSAPRKLLIRKASESPTPGGQFTQNHATRMWQSLPPALLVDTCIRMSLRLQALQCSEAASRMAGNSYAEPDPDYHPDDALALRDLDWCHYHEHESNEERDWCRLRKEGREAKRKAESDHHDCDHDNNVCGAFVVLE